MTPRKPDRRIQRTRQTLQETLIQLILEKGYEKISVRDICERANVGRTTFYAHFLDKDDLLEKSFAEFVNGLHHLLAQDKHKQTLLPLDRIFDHAGEQRDLFKAFLRPERLLQPAHRQLTAFVRQRLALFKPELSEMEKSVRAEFVIGGLLGVLRWWIEAAPDLSATEAAAMTQRLLDERPLSS
ncbi:MAG: TetR/AcrR family transcriptional regulator [Chloroflexota bacterium]